MWGSRINRHGAITTKEHAASLNTGTQACSLCAQRVSNPLIQDSGQHIRWAHRQECLCSESGTSILLMNSLKHRLEADATPIPVSYLKALATGSLDFRSE